MKYRIGDEFLEYSRGWHWRVVSLPGTPDALGRTDRYVMVDITGRASHSPLSVSENQIDDWLTSTLLTLVKIPCIYCGSEMEQFEDKRVCTECYRVEEE